MSGFIGSHRCKVDSKVRIQIPAGFRRHLSADGREIFVLSRSTDRYLILFAPEGWQEFQKKLNTQPAGKKRRQAIRYFSHNSTTLQLDKQGRVSIPKEFMADLGNEHEVQLVGALNYIELWRPQDFHAHLEEAREALSEMEDLL